MSGKDARTKYSVSESKGTPEGSETLVAFVYGTMWRAVEDMEGHWKLLSDAYLKTEMFYVRALHLWQPSTPVGKTGFDIHSYTSFCAA